MVEPPAEWTPPLLLDIRVENFSSLRRLQRVFVFAFRLLKVSLWDKLSEASRQRFGHLDLAMSVVNRTGPVTAEEVSAVFSRLLCNVQRRIYPELASGRPYNSLSKKLKSFRDSLNIRLDRQGLLRCYGRLANASIDLKAKFPVLLPDRKHHLSKLLVLDAHVRAFHQGEETTLAFLRKSLQGQVTRTSKGAADIRSLTWGPLAHR